MASVAPSPAFCMPTSNVNARRMPLGRPINAPPKNPAVYDGLAPIIPKSACSKFLQPRQWTHTLTLFALPTDLKSWRFSAHSARPGRVQTLPPADWGGASATISAGWPAERGLTGLWLPARVQGLSSPSVHVGRGPPGVFLFLFELGVAKAAKPVVPTPVWVDAFTQIDRVHRKRIGSIAAARTRAVEQG